MQAGIVHSLRSASGRGPSMASSRAGSGIPAPHDRGLARAVVQSEVPRNSGIFFFLRARGRRMVYSRYGGVRPRGRSSVIPKHLSALSGSSWHGCDTAGSGGGGLSGDARSWFVVHRQGHAKGPRCRAHPFSIKHGARKDHRVEIQGVEYMRNSRMTGRKMSVLRDESGMHPCRSRVHAGSPGHSRGYHGGVAENAAYGRYHRFTF